MPECRFTVNIPHIACVTWRHTIQRRRYTTGRLVKNALSKVYNDLPTHHLHLSQQNVHVMTDGVVTKVVCSFKACTHLVLRYHCSECAHASNLYTVTAMTWNYLLPWTFPTAGHRFQNCRITIDFWGHNNYRWYDLMASWNDNSWSDHTQTGQCGW